MEVKDFIFKESIQFKPLIKRFVKDYNLPINIFDEDLFAYYAELYEDFPMATWLSLVQNIKENYSGSVEAWLDYCGSVRDKAIEAVKNSPYYGEFNNCDMSQYSVKPPVGEHSCYTQETNGSVFLSVDLRKANFQALRYANVLTDNTYEDFIRKVGGDDYIINSKYLRQVIFGNCNPSRQVTIEKYLINKIRTLLEGVYLWNSTLFSTNSDEVVYKCPYDGGEFHHTNMKYKKQEIECLVKEKLGIDVKAEVFQVLKLAIYNVNGDNVDAYVKHNLIDGTDKLKKASTTFYPQIYKLWKGLEINEMDRKVYLENQIATFDQPLFIKDEK